MATENTGYKGYSTLLKVTNYGNNSFLDINNNLCSESGLPQATKSNTIGDPDYIAPVYDTVTCPIPNPPDDDPNNYTYYEAEYYDCVSETCGTEANPLWVFTLNTGLTKNMYYYYSDNVTGKSFKILGDPKTYTEYVALGEPVALKTTFVNAYVTCTCLPLD